MVGNGEYERTALPTPIFQRVAIVGVGLIGGSLGIAIRERGIARNVAGVDKAPDVLSVAVALGAVDDASTDLHILTGADCIVFAAPVGVVPELMTKAAIHIDRDALITDIGSVKRGIVATGTRLFGERFVGGHPMAGSEKSTIAFARSDLFQDAPWAIVPGDSESCAAVDATARIEGLAAAVGARPMRLTADRHDHIVAMISHLPHALSFAFTRTVAADPDADSARELAGASFRDLTRVAQSSPDLWADILLENRAPLLEALNDLNDRLRDLRAALHDGDRTKLTTYLETSRNFIDRRV